MINKPYNNNNNNKILPILLIITRGTLLEVYENTEPVNQGTIGRAEGLESRTPGLCQVTGGQVWHPNAPLITPQALSGPLNPQWPPEPSVASCDPLNPQRPPVTP